MFSILHTRKQAVICVKKHVLAFLQDRRGVITVEFALIAPVFIITLALCLGAARVQVATMLLERSLYDIAYQARVARGVGFEAIVQKVLLARNSGVFSPDAVEITATSSSKLSLLAIGGVPNAGGASDLVCLRLDANMGMFGALVGEENAKQAHYSVDYCYVNEPDLEAGS